MAYRFKDYQSVFYRKCWRFFRRCNDDEEIVYQVMRAKFWDGDIRIPNSLKAHSDVKYFIAQKRISMAKQNEGKILSGKEKELCLPSDERC